jgi:hypothetical protein
MYADPTIFVKKIKRYWLNKKLWIRKNFYIESVDLHEHQFLQPEAENHMLPKKVSWHEEEAVTPVHAKSGSRSRHISYCISVDLKVV